MWGCLADEHISHALVHALRLAGIDVVTVQQQGLAGASDQQVAATALAERRLLLTNDADFLRMVAEATNRPATVPPIIYWPRHARRTVKRLVEAIHAVAGQPDYESLCGSVYHV